MDNQNQIPPQPVTPEAPTPAPVSQEQPVATQPSQPKKSYKKTLLGLSLLLLALVLFAAGYLFMGQKQSAKVQPTPAVQSMQTRPTPTSAPASAEEQELKSIDTGDPTSDIKGLQNDAKNL
jgi:uncharacterized protein HemX